MKTRKFWWFSNVEAILHRLREHKVLTKWNKLDTLRKGDIVSVKDSKGTTISFVVRESKIYKLNADATEVFYSNDGKSHLNLVTCIQDKVTKKYPNRLVVFTDRI